MDQRYLQQPTTTAAAATTKWEATVTAGVANSSAAQIWPLLQDFFGIHKYFPSLSASYGVRGNNGEIGSVRHCEGFRIPAQESKGKDNDDDDDGSSSLTKPPPVSWSEEKIIAIDPSQRSLSYEMVDSNIGFNSYVSTIRILGNSESDHGGGDESVSVGCVLQWWFSVDPVEGLKFEDLAKKYEVGLQIMAQKMEDALSPN